MQLEEQMQAMQSQLTTLQEHITKLTSASQEVLAKPEGEGEAASHQQDVLIAQIQEQAGSKEQHKAQVAQMAQALKFISDELPTLGVSAQTQAVMDAYAGDKEDYVTHRNWIMRAYLKNEALARLREDELAQMPRLYQEAIRQAKVSEHFDVVHVFGMVREMEERAKQQAQAQAKLASLALANEISEAELRQLPQDKQLAYQATQGHRQAGIKFHWPKV